MRNKGETTYKPRMDSKPMMKRKRKNAGGGGKEEVGGEEGEKNVAGGSLLPLFFLRVEIRLDNKKKKKTFRRKATGVQMEGREGKKKGEKEERPRVHPVIISLDPVPASSLSEKEGA